MTRLLGIVNLTADSFSDGGRYLAPDAAIAHARRLVADGADAIDLGPASSHPDAAEVSADEERRRLEAVLPALVAAGVAVSVDSWRPETQAWACANGATWLNDIRGFPDPAVWPVLAEHAHVGLIAMFSVQAAGRATREATDAAGIVARVEAFFDRRLEALERAGVDLGRVIVDPGMGFFLGAGPAPSLAVIAALPRLRARWGRPLLVSASRKSFLRALTGSPLAEIGPATLAAELALARRGVEWIRTHDVRALRDALVVERAIEAAP